MVYLRSLDGLKEGSGLTPMVHQDRRPSTRRGSTPSFRRMAGAAPGRIVVSVNGGCCPTVQKTLCKKESIENANMMTAFNILNWFYFLFIWPAGR
jgi:hypothetical protein